MMFDESIGHFLGMVLGLTQNYRTFYVIFTISVESVFVAKI